MRCRLPLGVKDRKTIVYRTVFGKARLDSPRFYSACSRCTVPARTRQSFSPLAEQLPERVHPQWLWLQSRYAATMSYQLAQRFLRDAFPAGRVLAVSSVKRNTRRIGERLDREVQLGAQACIDTRCDW